MKSRMVTIGLIQSKVGNNVAANVKKTIALIRQAANKGAQIVCLSELFSTPYFPQRQGLKKTDFAETITGPTLKAMKSLAKELEIVLIVPFYEKSANGSYYNTAVVFDEKGRSLGQYHKIHIPHDPGFYEDEYFEAGGGYKVFKTKFGQFAVLICFDQWFPEAARACRLAGAEIIFYPTAIANVIGYVPPDGDWHDAWETVMRGHAVANSVVVAAANRTGIEGRSHFWGQSFICDAFGKVLKRANPTREQVVLAKVDLAMNSFIADGWGFLRDRRPDSYARLTETSLAGAKTKPVNIQQEEEKLRKILEK